MRARQENKSSDPMFRNGTSIGLNEFSTRGFAFRFGSTINVSVSLRNWNERTTKEGIVMQLRMSVTRPIDVLLRTLLAHLARISLFPFFCLLCFNNVVSVRLKRKKPWSRCDTEVTVAALCVWWKGARAVYTLIPCRLLVIFYWRPYRPYGTNWLSVSVG